LGPPGQSERLGGGAAWLVEAASRSGGGPLPPGGSGRGQVLVPQVRPARGHPVRRRLLQPGAGRGGGGTERVVEALRRLFESRRCTLAGAPKAPAGLRRRERLLEFLNGEGFRLHNGDKPTRFTSTSSSMDLLFSRDIQVALEGQAPTEPPTGHLDQRFSLRLPRFETPEPHPRPSSSPG